MSAEEFKDLEEARDHINSTLRLWNTTDIVDSGVPFESLNDGRTLVFKLPGMPVVSFMPGSSVWRVNGNDKWHEGSAVEFLRWLQNEARLKLARSRKKPR